MGRANPTVKSFEIPKRLVFEAWKKVRANDGAPGVDRVSITEFQSREGDLLYKLWNRMSAGSYMPSPVRAVEIPKDHGTGSECSGCQHWQTGSLRPQLRCCWKRRLSRSFILTAMAIVRGEVPMTHWP